MATLAGRSVGPTGFGLMGLTARSPQTPYEEAFKTMRAALAAGANLWNGGEFYGPPQSNSLHLLNAYFTKYPEDADKVVLSIKGGFVPGSFIPSGDKAGIKRSVENCLKILDGKKKIDIFECGRVDPNIPIEETVGHLAEFVKAGKIGGIGLSETAAATIRRAASVHPIVAVEVEYSIFARDIRHNEVASTCAELGIPIVAYSPLSRGLLTGKKMSPDDLTEAEKNWPRFQGENFLKNLELVKAINKVAEEKGCTPAQFAIGWVKAQSGSPGFPTIIPIPGATTVSRVEENMKDVPVTSAEFNEINKIIATIPVQGGRYPKSLEHLCFG